MDKNELSVSLNIYGHEDVARLTQYLGLKPDKALNKGEPLIEGAAPIPQSIWELKSTLSVHSSLEEHVVSLLDVLAPHKSELVEIAKKYKTVIAVGARYNEPNPEIVLEPAVLRKLADLGVSLWLDLYLPEQSVNIEKEH